MVLAQKTIVMKKIVLFIAMVFVTSYSFGQTRIKAKQIGGGSNGQIIQSDGTKGGWVDAPYIKWTDTLDNGTEQVITIYKLNNVLDNTSQFVRVESDPTVPSHVKNITTTDESNWTSAYDNHIKSASFATGTGILTLTQQDNGTVTVNMDGRYLTQTDAGNNYVKKNTSVNLGSGLNGSSDLSSNLSLQLDFNYLDGRYLSGFKPKDAAQASSSSNITLSGLQTIDGYTLQTNDSVLVMGQTDASENGIYDGKSGSWVRSSECDEVVTGEVEQGASVFVENGSNYGNTSWALKTGGTIVLGTTDLEFLQTAGSATYTAGSGLKLNETTFSVDNTVIQEKLTAGTNININASNVISATDTKYSAGSGLNLSGNTFSVDNTSLANDYITTGNEDQTKTGGLSIEGGFFDSNTGIGRNPSSQSYSAITLDDANAYNVLPQGYSSIVRTSTSV